MKSNLIPTACLLSVLPLVAAAQAFNSVHHKAGSPFFEGAGKGLGWTLTTETTIDAATPSLGWKSELTGTQLTSVFIYSVGTTIPDGPPPPVVFPFPPSPPPTRYTVDTLTVSYSVIPQGEAIVTYEAQGTPFYHFGIGGFTVPQPQSILTLRIGVSYTIMTDGVLAHSGELEYSVAGEFRPVVGINTDDYPLDIAPIMQSWRLNPVDDSPLASITTVAGTTFRIDPRFIQLQVPEPWQYGLASSLGLIGFALWRRR